MQGKKDFCEEDSDNIDWDTEDELEIEDTTFRDSTTTTAGYHAVIAGHGEVNKCSSG